MEKETEGQGLSFSKDQLWSWLDGQIHVLREGVHYPPGTPFADIRKRFRQAAWRRGVLVKITHLGDKVMVVSNEDANEHREALQAMSTREWTKEQIENRALMEAAATAQAQVQEWEERYAVLARQFSAYRQAHPPREL